MGDGENEKSSYGLKSVTIVPKGTFKVPDGLVVQKNSYVWCLELANET